MSTIPSATANANSSQQVPAESDQPENPAVARTQQAVESPLNGLSAWLSTRNGLSLKQRVSELEVEFCRFLKEEQAIHQFLKDQIDEISLLSRSRIVVMPFEPNLSNLSASLAQQGATLALQFPAPPCNGTQMAPVSSSAAHQNSFPEPTSHAYSASDIHPSLPEQAAQPQPRNTQENTCPAKENRKAKRKTPAEEDGSTGGNSRKPRGENFQRAAVARLKQQ